MRQKQKKTPANLRRNPATASDMALSFSSTHLPTRKHSFKRRNVLYICYITIPISARVAFQ